MSGCITVSHICAFKQVAVAEVLLANGKIACFSLPVDTMSASLEAFATVCDFQGNIKRLN